MIELKEDIVIDLIAANKSKTLYTINSNLYEKYKDYTKDFNNLLLNLNKNKNKNKDENII